MADEQEMKPMPPRKPSDDDRAIDRLTEALTQFRIDTARVQGESATKLDQVMKKIDALDGLFSRMAVAEKDIALLREQHTNFMSNVTGWKTDNDADKTGIAKDLKTLQEFRWALMGGLVVGQIVIGLFGPSMRAMLGLP